MKVIVFTSREFNQNYSKFTKAAEKGFVVVTYHGRPRYVFVKYADYVRVASGDRSLGFPTDEEILLAIEKSRKRKKS